jgi:hypothetical protein
VSHERRTGNLLSSLGRGGARGVIAAMAMSGLRQATTALGMVEKTPPEAILQQTAPRLFAAIPAERRPALVELVHWSYGGLGGAIFGALPRRLRRQGWIGPAYGFVFWAVFEAGIAPLLGMHKSRAGLSEQLGLLADHTLYGMVVASSPWPHAD